MSCLKNAYEVLLLRIMTGLENSTNSIKLPTPTTSLSLLLL